MSQTRTAAAPDVSGARPLEAEELRLIDAYWRVANYVSAGQIYLLDNPLLKRPLRLDDIKPRLLGHWGTTPGLNFIYAHANRVIKKRDLDAIYIMGPGHGGPAGVANAYLEGTYTERYPNVSRDETGIRNLFRQFSFPGGIPSQTRPRPPVPSTKAASSVTRSPTPTVRRSTTRSSPCSASSATARPSQDP